MQRSIFLRLFIDGSSRVATMLLTIFIARVLSIEDFGKFTFGLSYSIAFALLAESGTHFVFLREFSSSDAPQKVWSEFFGLKLSLVTVSWCLAAVLSYFLWPWQDFYVAIALTGYTMGNSLSDFFHQACNASERVELSAWITGFQRGACVLLALVALTKSPHLGSLVWALCFASLLGSMGGYWWIRRSLPFLVWPRWNIQVWATWWRASLPLMTIVISFGLTMRLGLLLLPYLGLIEETGIYSAAQRLLDVGNLIPSSLMMIALPHFTKIRRVSPDNFFVEVRKTFWVVLGTAIVAFAVSQYAAAPIVRLLFGDPYAAAVPLVRVLSGANALILINYFLVTILLVMNHQKRHFFHEMLCLAACAALTTILGLRWGTVGAAWALVITQILMLGLLLWALRQQPWNKTTESA